LTNKENPERMMASKEEQSDKLLGKTVFEPEGFSNPPT